MLDGDTGMLGERKDGREGRKEGRKEGRVGQDLDEYDDELSGFGSRGNLDMLDGDTIKITMITVC